MNTIEYAPLARRTLKELPYLQHMIHMGLGLAGEFGELLDAVKKHVVYGKEVDITNLTEETGDQTWYGINLIHELDVDPKVAQRALDSGFEQGCDRTASPDFLKLAGAVGGEQFAVAHDLLHLNMGMAAVISGGLLNSKIVPGSSQAVQIIEGVFGIIGTFCGLLCIDPGEAMELNIKKLAKRYGDKYSDVAALNRDTAAERTVLEGGEQ